MAILASAVGVPRSLPLPPPIGATGERKSRSTEGGQRGRGTAKTEKKHDHPQRSAPDPAARPRGRRSGQRRGPHLARHQQARGGWQGGPAGHRRGFDRRQVPPRRERAGRRAPVCQAARGPLPRGEVQAEEGGDEPRGGAPQEEGGQEGGAVGGQEGEGGGRGGRQGRGEAEGDRRQHVGKEAAAAAEEGGGGGGGAATKEDGAGAAGMPKITDWIKKAAAKPRPTASAARSAPAAPRPADRAPAGTASGTSTAVAAGPGRGLRDVPAPGGVKKGGVKKATKKSAPNPYGAPPPERKAAPTGGPKVVRSATAAPPAAELAKGGGRPTEVAASGPQASRHFQARKSLKNLGSRHNRALGSSSSRADAKGATVLQRLHASNHRAATMFVEGIVGGEGRSGGAPCATSAVGPSGGDGQASQGHSPASLSMDTE